MSAIIEKVIDISQLIKFKLLNQTPPQPPTPHPPEHPLPVVRVRVTPFKQRLLILMPVGWLTPANEHLTSRISLYADDTFPFPLCFIFYLIPLIIDQNKQRL